MPSQTQSPYHFYRDDELVCALGKGDRKAFEEIYERYWSALYRLVYQKIRSTEVAEELVQELFVDLWTRHQKAVIRELRPYLFGALRFLIIDFFESKTEHQQFLTLYNSFLSQNEAPNDNLALDDLRQAIEQSLGTLSEKSQQVFRLSRFEFLTIPEISGKLNLPEKTVEYHLSKALKTLRVSLGAFRNFML